jgi:hypothetical protein
MKGHCFLLIAKWRRSHPEFLALSGEAHWQLLFVSFFLQVISVAILPWNLALCCRLMYHLASESAGPCEHFRTATVAGLTGMFHVFRYYSTAKSFSARLVEA